MKFPVLIAAVLAAASAVSYEEVLEQEYEVYKAMYKKKYGDHVENFRRFQMYFHQKYKVAQHNLKFFKEETTFEMEINEFSDWFPEELERKNGFNKDLRDRAAAGEYVDFDNFDAELHVIINSTVPESANWVAKGAVTPVMDEGACSSSYAFSAIGALESQNFIKTNQYLRLSEQQIVDCSGEFGNFGCEGGHISYTYDYIRGVRGISTECSYPYEAYLDKCRHNQATNAANCTGYVRVKGGEKALKEAVANVGPVAVAINARDSLLWYKGGVYSDPECKSDIASLNRAVLVVGYGTDRYTKQDYWLVKNSWGTAWGEDGYVRMARNKRNMCGIATLAFYPLI